MHLQPIQVEDHDGLRLISKGHIGNYPVISFHNPVLIAAVVGQRKRRSLILEVNNRQWGDE